MGAHTPYDTTHIFPLQMIAQLIKGGCQTFSVLSKKKKKNTSKTTKKSSKYKLHMSDTRELMQAR